MNSKWITQAGYDKLKAELDNLKNVERPSISDAVGKAREMGDLKENAEYHTGKERQVQIENRIQFLEKVLMDSEIFNFNDNQNDDIIFFGATVEIEDLETNLKRTVKIIGEYEADIRNNMISIVSPLGISLLNRKINDVVIFEAPSGVKEYKIISVKY